MAITQPTAVRTHRKESGFVLLIAVIFMSVMLSFGLALGSLAFKQQQLSSAALESQYAFYAADAALECALYADQQQNLFGYTSHSAIVHPALITTVACNDTPSYASELSYSYDGTQLIVSQRFSLDAGKHCADVTVYKPNGVGTTRVYSQGYNVSCATVVTPAGARFATRGLNAHY